jgi:anaerobic nitric oxide reductase transcription regulator
VLLLAGFFLEQNRSRLGLRHLRLAADAQAALLHYSWPGNVRELEHLISRGTLKALVKLGERPRILSLTAVDLDLPAPIDDASEAPFTNAANKEAVAAGGGLRGAVDAYQRQLIAASLARNDRSWVRSARELGLDRANLRRLAARLGIAR